MPYILPFFFNWRQTARKQKQALVLIEFSGVSLHGVKNQQKIFPPKNHQKSREVGRRTAAKELRFFLSPANGGPTSYLFFFSAAERETEKFFSRASQPVDILPDSLYYNMTGGASSDDVRTTRGTDEDEERGAAGRRHRRHRGGGSEHAASGQLAACLHFLFDRERGPTKARAVGTSGRGRLVGDWLALWARIG
jgi:hypothetical protein